MQIVRSEGAHTHTHVRAVRNSWDLAGRYLVVRFNSITLAEIYRNQMRYGRKGEKSNGMVSGRCFLISTIANFFASSANQTDGNWYRVSFNFYNYVQPLVASLLISSAT